MSRFLFGILFLLFLLPAQISAEAFDVHYSLELHRIGAGVYGSAMGNAFVAAEPEAAHIYWNSASLASLADKKLYLSHTGLFGNIATYNTLLLAVPLPSKVGLGLGYLRYEDNDIPRYGLPQGTQLDRLRDPSLRLSGETDDFFKTAQDELLVSCAKEYLIDLPRNSFYSLPAPLSLSGGATFKFYRARIDQYYGYNANMDIGLLAQIGLQVDPKTNYVERQLSFGANLQDILGTSIDWRYSDNYQEKTIANYKVGVAFMERTSWVHGHLLFCVDMDRQYGDKISHFGAEYSWKERFSIRGGLDNEYPTVGAGIRYKYFRFDYAYSYHPLSSTPLQVGLQIAF